MRKKDLLELKKNFKKDKCSFTKVCGCYVNSEKHILLKFDETFLNLEEEDFFKYLEIAKKTLSGTLGNNILELSFPLDENFQNEKQMSLIGLKKSKLKEEALLDSFYKTIIDAYQFEGNFLILLFHDVYDIISRTSDNNKLDESEEVYEYILCAICPVSLSEPGLKYFEDERKIRAKIREWIVDKPTIGFIYPAFIDRGPDVNSIIYYTKNPKDPHPEVMEEALDCLPRQTISLQRESFQSIFEASLNEDEETTKTLFMDIQENLNEIVEEHKVNFEGVDADPPILDKYSVKNILKANNVPENAVEQMEKYFEEVFEDDAPLMESLIDKKILKEKKQRKLELELSKKVEVLQTKLEDLNLDEEISEDEIILKVSPNKIDLIKKDLIDGKKYLLVPLNDNEKTRINGREI